MKRWMCAWVVLAGVLVAGCGTNYLDVDIRPAADGTFERTLRCWRYEPAQSLWDPVPDDPKYGAFPKVWLSKIAALYGATVPAQLDRKHTFSKRFRRQTPDDVGGRGFLLHWSSPYGHINAYNERFGGTDDFEALVESRRRAADMLVDEITAWLRQELGKEEGFNRLEKLIEERFRPDMRNLSHAIWSQQNLERVSAKDDYLAGLLARVVQFLAERDWLEPELAFRLIASSGGSVQPPPLRFLAARVAAGMGRPHDRTLLPRLAFLESFEGIKASLGAYLETTERYRKALAAWKALPPEERTSERPEPFGDLSDAFNTEFFGDLSDTAAGERGIVRVRLFCRTEPEETNGAYDAKTQIVTWSFQQPSSTRLPRFCRAVWAEVDEAAQKAVFGYVVYGPAELGEAALWYRALTKRQRTAWDRFLDGVRRAPDHKRAMQSYTFEKALEDPADRTVLERGHAQLIKAYKRAGNGR